MNKVILVGRLTKEPELRETTSGVSVCSFTVACDRKYVKQGEERKADFINCIAWRQTGEGIAKYFTKGTRIALEGTLQTRSWTDPEGKTRYTMEVIVDGWEFAQSKNEGGTVSPAPVENATQSNFGSVTQNASDAARQFGTGFGGQNDEMDIDGFIPIDDCDIPF